MCTSPRARCERIGDTYLTKEGKVAYNCDHFAWSEIEKNPTYFKMRYHKVDMYPCGQCLECRLNYSREWANRIVLEQRLTPKDQAWFLTLTYSDEHLYYNVTVNTETGERFEGMSVYKKHYQDFMKRLRSEYKRKHNAENIRFFACGEYGSQNGRPHYHAIIFNLPIDQTKLKIYRHNDMGNPIWTYDEIEKIWGKGKVFIGRVTWESAAYVARYNVKKFKGPNANFLYGIQGKEPEFVLMSRKPGIGMKYFEKHKEDIYTTDSIPIANKKTLQNVVPPKAFDKAMEKLEPELMEQLKKDRKKNAESMERAKNILSDLEPQERRNIKNQTLNEKMKALRREL